MANLTEDEQKALAQAVAAEGEAQREAVLARILRARETTQRVATQALGRVIPLRVPTAAPKNEPEPPKAG